MEVNFPGMGGVDGVGTTFFKNQSAAGTELFITGKMSDCSCFSKELLGSPIPYVS